MTNKVKCKCGQESIGYIGLTTTPQTPICKNCLEKLEKKIEE